MGSMAKSQGRGGMTITIQNSLFEKAFSMLGRINHPAAMSVTTKKARTMNIQTFFLLLISFSVPLNAAAATNSSQQDQQASLKQYSPQAGNNHPGQVFWGDTHLHTKLSVDAYLNSNRTLGPAEAYRFAKGKDIKTHDGKSVRLRRPLDFLVIADHGFNMGVMSGIDAGNKMLLATEAGQRWRDRQKDVIDSQPKDYSFRDLGKRSNDFYRSAIHNNIDNKAFTQSLWQRTSALADKHNDPGTFTTLIGYEWTAVSPAHIHRVVVFKDGADKVSTVLPFSRFDSEKPEDLWRYFSHYEQQTGGEVLAIPHNGNVTDGQLFKPQDTYGKPFNATYARLRSRWEPLFEVTQIKGDSEAHPLLSPNDEFADFETWNSWSGRSLGHEYTQSESGDWERGEEKTWSPEERKKKSFEYARPALKLGLQHQARLGVNPFKFGLIGSTDSHTSLATADEANFWGKHSTRGPDEKRMMAPSGYPSVGWENAAQGYAAVWAKENTRESLFAAMKRKEVYASTGPRITVRFFAGWDFKSDDAFSPNLASIGYQKGVPMGGDLSNAPNNKSPQFLIRAVKDPDGANLDRVQVIKGWHDAKGELHEKIYNVAMSDNRKTNWRGNVKPVGSTVNIESASYTNTIGEPELAVVWEDPDFNKSELSFYYLRVLEIPTPRWTAYDAKFFGLKDVPKEVPMVTQERAYTSPIWFSPN